jgi:diacylglycerol kinase (ATP)
MGRPLDNRVRSFRVAFGGIATMLRSEFNARVHALATIVVVAAGFGFKIDTYEWLAVILAISGVWSAEAFNTAIEALGDAVTREEHPGIGRAKDMAAGAVLLTALGATAIAAIVFGRRLIALIAS